MLQMSLPVTVKRHCDLVKSHGGSIGSHSITVITLSTGALTLPSNSAAVGTLVIISEEVAEAEVQQIYC